MFRNYLTGGSWMNRVWVHGRLLVTYVLVAVRRLRRDRVYVGTSIMGLSIGFAVMVLSLQFVQHEFGMDKFHQFSDRIYRVVRVTTAERLGPGPHYHHLTWGTLGSELGKSVPAVAEWVRVADAPLWIRAPGQNAIQANAIFTDTTFLQVFSFRATAPARSLSDPYAVLLSSSLAEKLFGSDEHIGAQVEVLSMGAVVTLHVAGIIEDAPAQSSMRPEALLALESPVSPFRSALNGRKEILSTFVLQKEGTDADALRAAVRTFPMGPGVSEDSLALQSLTDIYLNDNIGGNGSAPIFSGAFLTCAVLLLVLASVNFANLAIGMFGRRVGEVHLRKAIGAQGYQVVVQHLVEVFLQVVLSAIVGAALGDYFLPYLGPLINRNLSMDWSALFFGELAAAVAVATVIGGAYPALLLAKVSPVAARTRGVHVGGRRWAGRVLVGSQFAISTLALVSGLVIHGQVRYMMTTDLRYPADELAVIRLDGGDKNPRAENRQVVDRLRLEALKLDGVTGLSGCTAFGLEKIGKTDATVYANMLDPDLYDRMSYEEVAKWTDLTVHANVIEGNLDLAQVLGLRTAAGKAVDPPARTGRQVLVNETARRVLKLEHAVGAPLPEFRDGVVIDSVVEDFHYEPLHRIIWPLVMVLSDNVAPSQVMVRSRPGQLYTALRSIEAVWAEIAPGLPFQATPLLDMHQEELKLMRRLGDIALSVAVLCLCIGLLGVYAMAALAVASRSQEIAIRKVLGATSRHILWLVARDTLTPLLPAIIVGCGLARFAMGEYVTQFAVQVELGPAWFAAGAAATLGTAGLTVMMQVRRVANAAPAATLRTA